MALKLITPAASFPVTLAQAKLHLNVTEDDYDSLIESYLGAATNYAQRFLGRALVDQTWELTLDKFPDGEIKIPNPPLLEVVSVKYDAGADDEQTLTDGTDYTVDLVSEPGRVLPVSSGSWPTPFDGINAVRIRYRAGYLDANSPPAANVPEDIKSAIKLIVGTLYANRETLVVGEAVTQLPWAAEQLLRFNRIDLSMA